MTKMNRKGRNRNRIRIAALTAATSLTSVSGWTSAATDTWIGGGGNGNWSTAGNWNSGTGNAPPLATDILQFSGTSNLVTNNDFAANTQFNGINFLSGAGPFTLGGNAVLLAGNLDNASAAAQTVN